MSEEATPEEQARIDAINRCREILGEHFDSCVLVVQTEINDKQDFVNEYYHGGFITAIGLPHNGIHSLHKHNEKENEDDD